LRVFLCEGIGVYYPLINHLDKEQPIYGLVTEVASDYPRVEDLAAAYVAEVRALQPEGPYYLGGLSFGGIVAYEMAQQLAAVGQEVALLALFDTPTPWAFTRKPILGRFFGHLSNLRRFGFRYLEMKFGHRLNVFRRRNVRQSPDSTTAILSDTRRLRDLLSTSASNYHMRTYPGRATLFVLGGRDGMSDSLFDPAMGEIDPQLGWGRIVAGEIEVHEVPGEHVSMFREPNVRILAEKLNQCLETARSPASQ
jgi:thioesterase domain-containing protein